MKKLGFSFCLLWTLAAHAQNKYWQQTVNYKIDVTLDEKEKSLQGKETIEYINNSPETINFIWFQLYANAYSDDNTAYVQQISKDEKLQKKWKKTKKGFVDGLAFVIDGKKVNAQISAVNPDMLKLNLPAPLLPGKKITIETPFHVQLPSFISRSGYQDDMFMICQWFPKPAVFDRKGWHNFSYLDQGEFYSDYGSYDVNITVPADYVVGATGTLTSADELNQLKTIGKVNNDRRLGKPTLYKYAGSEATKTLNYKAENVPDFAWFADKSFVVLYDTTALASGKVIDVFSFHHNTKTTPWSSSIDYIKDAVAHYSSWIGEYAYPVVAAVEGPKQLSSGGMEYPMITMITSPDASVKVLDAVITHEVGHNWFMCMLGTNERDHAWMDEGLNSFYQFRYEAEKYKHNTALMGEKPVKELQTMTTEEFEKVIYGVIEKELPLDGYAIETPSPDFVDKDKYGTIIYVKTPLWFSIVEDFIGKDKLQETMHAYFDKWHFKHPYPEDFQKVMEDVVGKPLDNLFALLKKKEKL
jgi:hypothetical protein